LAPTARPGLSCLGGLFHERPLERPSPSTIGNHPVFMVFDTHHKQWRPMEKKYDLRKGPNELWEVFEVATGAIVEMGGILLSGLDLDAAKGAIDALHNQLVQPNSPPQQSSGTDEDSA
jgi:hypothetical protein